MICDVRKIKKISDDNKIEGKIIKEDMEVKIFPTPGTKIKISNRMMTIHSVYIPKESSKNKIINVH
jgi:hypothetical protein